MRHLARALAARPWPVTPLPLCGGLLWFVGPRAHAGVQESDRRRRQRLIGSRQSCDGARNRLPWCFCICSFSRRRDGDIGNSRPARGRRCRCRRRRRARLGSMCTRALLTMLGNTPCGAGPSQQRVDQMNRSSLVPSHLHRVDVDASKANRCAPSSSAPTVLVWTAQRSVRPTPPAGLARDSQASCVWP